MAELALIVSGVALLILVGKVVKSRLLIIVMSTILAFMTGMTITSALGVKAYKVSGTSMYPTLVDGQITICIPTNREEGDIVQLRSPVRPGIVWVKRIIGVPGDRIAVWGNHVEVNGVADTTSEKYQKSTLRPRVFVLQYNQYFVCGDNREVSYDSRYVGPIEKELILTETLLSF